jgi:hypothetical protein
MPINLLIIFGAIILLTLLWFLSAELEKVFFGQKQGADVSAIGSLDDEFDNLPEKEKPEWLVNFAQWAGPRQLVSVERIGFTILWMIFLFSLIDHLRSRTGFTGTLIYFLTVLPHEAGHFLCSPFGWFLSVAGGSIWQVLLFIFLGLIVFFRKRKNEALGWWAVAGHSLINLSTYIADASTRSLTLIPIPDPARHDWGNMLEFLGLLKYDWLFAQMAVALGGGVVLSMVVIGLFFTWYQPGKVVQ